MIECFGICSEYCTAWQNGKCVLDAKKAEGANDFQLYKEDEENAEWDTKHMNATAVEQTIYADITADKIKQKGKRL